MMTKVYIINRGGHDHSDAERFGELVFLSQGSINRYAASQIYRQFVDALRDSHSDDYILITGLSVMSSIACAIFSRLHGRLNLLLYRGGNGKYVERKLVIDELLEGGPNDR